MLRALGRTRRGLDRRGTSPNSFVHTADDRDVPTSCAAFHAALSRHIGVGSIPAWPACPGAAGGEQISLFDP